MNKLLSSAIAVSLAFSATAAGAVSMVIPNGADGSVFLDDDGSTLSWEVDYLGYGGDPEHDLPGLSALGTFSFLGVINDGKTYRFSYTLTNDSTANSRLSVFGFDIDPNANLSVSTGAGNLFDLPVLNPSGNIPAGFGSVDFCLKTDGQTNNCNNGSLGLDKGQSTSGTFNLNYVNAPGDVTLDRFFVRYQTVSGLPGRDANIDSAIGIGTPGGVIPEPGSWALLIVGFGVVGVMMRRRRGPRLSFA